MINTYYNEFDKKKCAALRQLMTDGHISKGDIDDRPIQDVRPEDLRGYTRCHFFAGIGLWDFALDLAGWPQDLSVWTGSCPCQPFSSAGRQKGKADDRHLWPEWFRLIKQCKPPTIFGEQVASAIAQGWLDDVYQGLEAQDYAVGAAVLPACSVGAPHRRDRLWFVADTKSQQSYVRQRRSYTTSYPQKGDQKQVGAPGGTMGNAKHDGSFAPAESAGRKATVHHDSQRPNSSCQSQRTGEPECLSKSTMGNPECIRSQRQGELPRPSNSAPCSKRQADQFINDSAGHWKNAQWINCPDGKQRLIEPRIPLLAHGYPERVGVIHSAGDAIVPQVAAEFIGAFMEI